MTRRRLRPDEVDLWHKVVQNTDRLHPERSEPPRPQPAPKVTVSGPAPPPIEPLEFGKTATRSAPGHRLKPMLSDHISNLPLQMDQKAFTRMKRGRIRPEARLDLHGMRVDAAHPALIRFILSAQASGKRLVLVITGKGKDRDEPGPIPTPRGVLRNQVPQWLTLPPVAQAVLQVSAAHVSHGGDGAYYVYLRRTR